MFYRRLRKRSMASGMVLLISLSVIRCTQVPPPSPPPLTPYSPAISSPPPASPTASPSPPPQRVILVAPAGDRSGTLLQSQLTILAAEAGLQLDTVPGFPDDGLIDNIRIVVVLTQVETLADLAAASPDTQFIAVALPNLSPAPNLTVIAPVSDLTDDQAFLGGYLSALISDEWRVASITEAGSVLGDTTRIAFANGAKFFCGLCRPTLPPYSRYPLDFQIDRGAGSAEQSFLLDELSSNAVEVAYLQPGLLDLELGGMMVERGIYLIGAETPELAPASKWVATIDPDPARVLVSIWPAVMNGESQGMLQMPLRVSVQEPTKLTPGRLQFAQELIRDLYEGFIDTGVDPETGQPQ